MTTYKYINSLGTVWYKKPDVCFIVELPNEKGFIKINYPSGQCGPSKFLSPFRSDTDYLHLMGWVSEAIYADLKHLDMQYGEISESDSLLLGTTLAEAKMRWQDDEDRFRILGML